MTKLLIAIPCFNEAENIVRTIHNLPKKIENIDTIDILVIDDGSIDKSSELAVLAGAIVISHKKNLGVGKVFQDAVDYAILHDYDIMVNIDADGQFNPMDIQKLLDPICKNKADMVTGSRFFDNKIIKNMPLIKYYGNKIMSFLISKLTGDIFSDVSCGFRAYSRYCLLNFNLQGYFTYTQESFLEISSKNLQICEVPINVKYFSARKSRVAYSIVKYAINTLYIIFRCYRDYYPLRFFWALSTIFFVPAILFAFVFFYRYYVTGLFSGNLYMGFLSGFLFMLSIAFFVVGLFADMLSRLRRNQEKILNILKSEK